MRKGKSDQRRNPKRGPTPGRGTESKNRNDKVVGVVVSEAGKLRIKPCQRKNDGILYEIANSGTAPAVKIGDVVVAEAANGSTSAFVVTVKRVLGNASSPGILSLISLCEKGLREEFSAAAKNETKGMTVPALGAREDLRQIPLVTIDGADSRDFDDAVFAEKTADGGFHLIVAIADVAHYVRPNSELDKEAYARGNSTYFPDRVLPMLPEELSNELCSLKPNEDRACLAFHMYINKDGQLTGKKLVRGLMKSAARLTYDQVQAAQDGAPDATTAPLMKTVIEPLYEAYRVLRAAREKRGAIDLDMAAVKIAVDENGVTTGVNAQVRGDSHRLIEEFMVLANVAAATALEEKGSPCVYRVHAAPPSEDKIDILRERVKAIGIDLPPGELKDPAIFKDLAEKVSKLPGGEALLDAILRVQAKAAYDTDNIGHFGLALESYAHFTSPIRRYADLLVHRSLIAAFNLGSGALTGAQATDLQAMAEYISQTEKASAQAERMADARITARHLEKDVGKTFAGRVTQVGYAGVFVRLDECGGMGLVPFARGTFTVDEVSGTLRTHNGQTWKTGAKVQVDLKSADGLTGRIALKPAGGSNDNAPKQKKDLKR